MNEEAQTVSIDGTDYPIDTLSEEAKSQFANVKLVDQKIIELQQELAIAQTARNAYGKALAEALPRDPN